VSLKRQSKLEHPRHEVVVRFVGWHCFAVANTYGSRFWRRSFALFLCQLFHFGEDLIRGQYPVHWNGVAPFRWTTESHRPVASGSASDLDLPPRNEFAANQAVTFLV
jgi:hypothetical protein